jgi:putative NADH-flavin reductase
MKIVVFVASGGTGVLIVEQALSAGYDVLAFVRDPAKLALKSPKLTIVQGNVLVPSQVEQAILGQDAVVSALGPTRPYTPGLLENAVKNIASAIKKHGVRRLISTGGTVVHDPQDRPTLLDRSIKLLMSLPGREIIHDAEKSNQLIRTTDLAWTIARYPMRLTNGPRTGHYRTGYLGRNVSMQLSRADGADFVIQELTNGKFIKKAPVVSY